MKGPWNEGFIEEFIACDKGRHDDLADTASGRMKMLPIVEGGRQDYTTE